MTAPALPQRAIGAPDRRHLSAPLLLLGIFLVIIVLRGLSLWEGHAQAVEDGRARAQSLALILGEHLARTLEGYDAALAQLAVHSQRIGGPTAPAEAWTAVLQAAKAGLAGVGSFSVTDAEGVIRHSTVAQIVGQSRRDRFVMGRLASDKSGDLVADTPFVSLTTGRYIVPLGRRLNDANGAFAGAIVVTFEPEGLREFYRSIKVGMSGIVWVLHPAGLVLFREPSASNPMGESAIENAILRAQRAEPTRGNLRGSFEPGGQTYLTAYRHLDRPPLIVAASLAEPDVLARWRDEVLASGGVLALVGALLGFGARSLNREMGARREAESELESKIDALQRVIAERDQVFAELSASQARFQAVMDHAPVPVVLKDLDGRFVFVNRAAEQWAGYAAAEVVGKTAFDILPAEEAREQTASDRQVIAKCAPIREEVKRTAPAGTRTTLSLKFPIFDSTGTLSSVGVVLVDLTAQKEMEAQLRQSQKMEAVGQLTGGIAHDFNNLLTAIMLNADLLAQQLADNALLRPLAQMTLEAAERGAELTGRLLAFSRQQVLEARAVDVNRLVAGMEQLMHRSLGDHITIALILSGDLHAAYVDPGQLETSLLNLAVNARDAMPEGGRLTIETANVVLDDSYVDMNVEVTAGEYVMLVVSDTGAGMSAEVAARVFEPFFTTKGVGKGTGLGLSMVYGFVRQSGGHVKIYSEPGAGTAVKIYLPRAKAAAAEEPGPRPEPAPLPGGSELILLVEDDPLVRTNTGRLLESLGYAVVSAEHAADALAKADAGVVPDLLLTDVVMPGRINGFELAHRLRERWPALRVLLTSGYTQGATPHPESAAAPTSGFLGKPFRRADLARKVREALDTPPV